MLLPAIALGLGIIIAAIVASYTFYAVRSLDNTITVTGSATQEATADSAKWRIYINRTAFEGTIPATYAAVEKDMASIKQYLKQQGLTDENFDTGSISADQNYTQNGPQTYTVRQTLSVSSPDVQKIEALSQSISSLVARGILFSTQDPEYYISGLPEIRIQLLGKAVADARARAQELVKESGSGVGKLKSAASGVVQVLAPNSTNVEDYGTYDTSTISKQIMVTARATFFVK